jgi:hypothetical protein
LNATLIHFVERVLASPLLTPDLVCVPDRGATDAELASVFNAQQDSSLMTLLRRWNGLDLDVIRIHGVGITSDGLPCVASTPHGHAVASDPSGFQYIRLPDGTISSFDHDGGSLTSVANDFDDFLRNYVFGNRSAAFCGDEWAAEVASSLA